MDYRASAAGRGRGFGELRDSSATFDAGATQRQAARFALLHGSAEYLLAFTEMTGLDFNAGRRYRHDER